MSTFWRAIFCLLGYFAIIGCQESVVPAAPQDSISIADAMRDIGNGFAQFRKTADQENNLNLNIYPCMITVNFAVSAQASKDGKLALDVSAKAPSGISGASAGYSQDNSAASNQANTIVITMESGACLDRDIDVAEAGTNKSPNGGSVDQTPNTPTKSSAVGPKQSVLGGSGPPGPIAKNGPNIPATPSTHSGSNQFPIGPPLALVPTPSSEETPVDSPAVPAWTSGVSNPNYPHFVEGPSKQLNSGQSMIPSDQSQKIWGDLPSTVQNELLGGHSILIERVAPNGW